MPAFQQFQREWALHLRAPHHTRRPAGVPARASALYAELLFGKLCGFVDSCFPVCRELLGEKRWRLLCRRFYRDWPSHTPWFREIPAEFVRYLEAQAATAPWPRWLPDLARYEWAELAVELMEVEVPAHNPQGDFMADRVLLNPARMDLACDWPVHRIGPGWRPRQPSATFLVVFRDADQAVRFTELNAFTAQALAALDAGHGGRQVFEHLARQMAHPQPQALQGFGLQLLHGLREQGLVLGTLS